MSLESRRRLRCPAHQKWFVLVRDGDQGCGHRQSMLCYIDHILQVKIMSIGSSGRIVIEVETGIKRELYSALSREGMTLKEWFLQSANSYISDRTQIPLPLSNSSVGAGEPSMNNGSKNGA